jgi:hypothetical protein
MQLTFLNAVLLLAPGGDFMLAQFALVAKGDLKKGCKRVINYHKIVTEEFGYTTEKAMASAFGFVNRKWPGTMLGAGKDHDHHQIIAIDMATYLPKLLVSRLQV